MRTDLSGAADEGQDVVVQPDGKIAMVGAAFTGSNWDFAVARYNMDGSLDTSFDGDGQVTTAIGTEADHGYSIALQADGKILVAGDATVGGWYDFALARYNSDGSLDTTFHGDGMVTTGIGSRNDSGTAVALQPDGKILVSGYTEVEPFVNDFSVVRYNSDGSLDTTFDGDGKVSTDVGGNNDLGYAMALQPDGKILVGGQSSNGLDFDFALVRYNADGSLDTSFDGDGKVTTAIGTGDDYGYGIALQPDGRILLAGYANLQSDFALARYNSDGSLDTTFDGDGKLTTSFGSGSDAARAITLQPDGKILVAGYATPGSNWDFAVARYNMDGSLDTSFYGDGTVTTPIGSFTDYGGAIALQADGKILVAGYSNDGSSSTTDFSLVRYSADGGLDVCYDGIDPLLQTFYWYDDTAPFTYMSYQTAPAGTATSATNMTVNFYSDQWPAGWGVGSSVMNYLGFWADGRNKTFTVNVYGGTTMLGTLTQTVNTSGIEGQAFFVTTSAYTFATGERLRVEFIVPRNMTLYWDGAYWESRFQLDQPIIVP